MYQTLIDISEKSVHAPLLSVNHAYLQVLNGMKVIGRCFCNANL